MEEKEIQSREETQHGGGVLRWVWIAGLGLVFYVLSAGPMAKLYDKGLVSGSILNVYAPLALLCERSHAASRFFDWYVEDVWRAN